MTKQELIRQVAQKQGITQQTAKSIVNNILESVTQTMARDEKVEIRGFGSFVVKRYDGYTGKNPGTGQPVQVQPKRLPFFKVGKELKERVNSI